MKDLKLLSPAAAAASAYMSTNQLCTSTILEAYYDTSYSVDNLKSIK